MSIPPVAPGDTNPNTNTEPGSDPHTGPHAEPDRLALLVGSLAESFRGEDGPPVAVGVGEPDADTASRGAPPDRTGELFVHRLLDGDPAQEVVGFRAPAGWTAFGIASRARLRHLDTGEPLAGEAGFALCCSRSGWSTWAIAPPSGALMAQTTRGPAQGRIADACRRVLGLSTEPAAHDSRALMAVQWLDALAARALAAEPGALTWPEVALANPYAELVTDRSSDLSHQLPDHLIELGYAFAKAWPWSRLRAEHRAGRQGGLGITAADAGWMDDAMFARWAIDWYPPLADLLDIAEARLDPALARRVRSTLADWGLDQLNRSRPDLPEPCS
jgi:hypothetical protein